MSDASPFSLANRSVLITGASSGIGKALAVLASGMGALCVLSGRDQARLEETRSLLQGCGHVTVPGDVTPGFQDEQWDRIVGAAGPLWGFVHCAGIEKTLPFRSSGLDDLHGISAVNVDAFWNLVQGLLRRGRHVPGELSVVAVSSAAGLHGAAGKTAYAASKGALLSLVRSLAAEYAPKRIRFNCLCPGYVETPMLQSLKALYGDPEQFRRAISDRHPLGLGRPEDVAAAAVFLLSGASKWVTGTALEVDGGYAVR